MGLRALASCSLGPPYFAQTPSPSDALGCIRCRRESVPPDGAETMMSSVLRSRGNMSVCPRLHRPGLRPGVRLLSKAKPMILSVHFRPNKSRGYA